MVGASLSGGSTCAVAIAAPLKAVAEMAAARMLMCLLRCIGLLLYRRGGPLGPVAWSPYGPSAKARQLPARSR